MNSLALFALICVVSLMGFRFYAKFLSLGVFRINPEAPAQASANESNRDFVPTNRWILLGYHSAAVIGIIPILGAGIAIVWGWIPAFLWILVGTLIAGGTYALGSLWASLRKNGDSLASVVFDLAGVTGALPVYFLGVVLLVLVPGIIALLVGHLLDAHPEATWSFLLLLPATILIRKALAMRSVANKVGLIIGAAGLLVLGLGLGQWLPLSLDGAWTMSLAGTDVVSLPGELVWGALALLLAHRSAKTSVEHTARPRGLMMTVILLVVMLGVIAGLLLTSPDLTAPQFQTGGSVPSPFPLLFIVLTGGALSGFHALIAAGPTVRQLRHQQDAAMVSYGSIAIEGLLALLVLIVLAAGFTTTQEWSALYGLWPDHAALYNWLDLAITKLARFIAAIGIPYPWTIGLVALTCAGLALTVLESTVRVLGYAVREFVEDFEVDALHGPNVCNNLALSFAAVALIWLAQTEFGLAHWLLLGVTNQLFACCVLFALALILMRLSRNALFLAIPFLILLPLTIWGLGVLLIDWWRDQEWVLLALACLISALSVWSLAVGLRVFLRLRRRPNDDPATAAFLE